MNEKDKFAIKELREKLADVMVANFTDFDCLRWLQGHDYKIDIITPKLRHHMRVLRSYDYESHQDHPLMVKYWPWGMLDVSGKDNNLVFLQATGKMDGVFIMKCLNNTTVMKHLIHGMEKILSLIRKQEENSGEQSGLLFIIDLDGLMFDENLLFLVKGPLRIMLAAYTLHYAEFMQKTLIINLPSYVYYLYQIVKPVLPEKTRRKVHFLGSNWKEDILNHIHTDVLPVHWGGNLTDANGNPRCPDKVTIPMQGDPCDFYVPGANDPKKSELKSFTVSPWRYDYVTVKVEKPGSTLEWYFFTNSDFGFGVFHTMDEKEFNADCMDMVYPQVARLCAAIHVPEFDKIVCKTAGFYKLWFSNEFSWIHRLKIHYKVVCKISE